MAGVGTPPQSRGALDAIVPEVAREWHGPRWEGLAVEKTHDALLEDPVPRVEKQQVTPLFRDLIGLGIRLQDPPVHRLDPPFALTRALECVIDLLLIPLDDRQFLVVPIQNLPTFFNFFRFGGQVNNLFLLL